MITPTSLMRKRRHRAGYWHAPSYSAAGWWRALQTPVLALNPNLQSLPSECGAQESGFLTSSQGIHEHIKRSNAALKNLLSQSHLHCFGLRNS